MVVSTNTKARPQALAEVVVRDNPVLIIGGNPTITNKLVAEQPSTPPEHLKRQGTTAEATAKATAAT